MIMMSTLLIANNNAREPRTKTESYYNEQVLDIPAETDDEDEAQSVGSNKLANITVYPRVLLSILLLIFSVNFNLAVLAVIHERVPETSSLPDVMFDLLPKSSRALDVSEYLIIVMALLVLILISFHRHRSILIRRMCMILSALYLLRGVCMGITQVPVANKDYYCSPKSNLTEITTNWEYIKLILSRINYMSLGMGLSINGHHSFCGDYIFSGHTTILVFSYLLLKEYLFVTKQHWLWKIGRFLCALVVVIGIMCILVAHGHYSIDIVIAYFATTSIFYIYHAMCATVNLDGASKWWSNFWWYHVVRMVEVEVFVYKVKLDNHFDTPLDIWKRIRSKK